MKEFGDGHVVGALGEELGHSDVVAAEEFGDGRVEIVCQVMANLVMISRHVLVEEFGDGDVVAWLIEVLGHSNAILLFEEFSDSHIVGPLVEELGHTNVPVCLLLLKELRHHGLQVLCDRNIIHSLLQVLSDCHITIALSQVLGNS